MKHSSPDVNNIFTGKIDFTATALNFFNYQYAENSVYRQWCDVTKTDNVQTLQQIAYLPISFFKTHAVKTGEYEPQIAFSSSGTTQTINSNHFVRDVSVYEESFIKAFELFYGDIKDWCIIGLLPAYLERKGSSLVYMVDKLIGLSGNPLSGFYLDEFGKLAEVLKQTESNGQKVLLIGVTFALLDFAEQFPMPLKHTTIMETGGMKGRRRELTRQEVHGLLHKGLGVSAIHSEYGMTELLSQAYSKVEGRFVCPPWMKILVRDEEDPFLVKTSGRGIINVIDLANHDSCCFIATDDVGIVYEDGSFEVWGRLDNSDIRGCSLLVV
ncbi:acyl transferase [Danxiaibacter flavus]|uniref:Acyl transferase n=1 Tax=Danxiaibacter flavus TaxID=3049108 RepID=A0ABV3ZBV3_9BACT|nr:acyl transferase [Chitinophagaceae bacterium DXS]